MRPRHLLPFVLAALAFSCGGSSGTPPTICGGLVTPAKVQPTVAKPSFSPVPTPADAGTAARKPASTPAPQGAGAATAFCPSLMVSGNGSGTPFTVFGTVTYEDHPYTIYGFTGATPQVPVVNAVVELVRCDDGTVQQTATTQADGSYTITHTNAGPAGMYVRARTQTPAGPDFDVTVQDTAGNVYAVRDPGFDDASSPSFTVNLQATQSAGVGGPFNILDVARRGLEYTAANLPAAMPLPALKIVWQEGYSAFGTAYYPSMTRIYVVNEPTDTDEYDDPVVMHEVGHFVGFTVSRDSTPGGDHFADDVAQDARLSWSEGWGDFFATAALGQPVYIDTNGTTDPPFIQIDVDWVTVGGGVTNELDVAATLWDTVDGIGSDVSPLHVDNVSLSPALVFGALADITLTAEPVTFASWWNRLRLVASGAELSAMQNLALSHTIDLFPDAGSAPGDIAGNDTPPGAMPTSGTTVTGSLAYHAETKPSDADYYTVDLTAGTRYAICTHNLSNGADTALEILDATDSSLLASNDNWNNAIYTARCAAFGQCPANNATNLASSLSFSPPATGSYQIRVTRSAAAPASAGQFGNYWLTVAVP